MLERLASDGRLSSRDVLGLDEQRRFDASANEIARLARSEPEFAGAAIDRSESAGILKIWLTSDPGQQVRDLVDRFPWPDRLRLEYVPRSLGDLEHLHDQVREARRRSELLREARWTSWIAEDSNEIKVLVESSKIQLARSELARFGDAVVVLDSVD